MRGRLKNLGPMLQWGLPLAFALACGSKKKEEGPRDLPPSEGQANAKVVLTAVGQGDALPADAASTNAKFSYVLAVPTKVAVVGGTAPGEAVAMRTENSGRDWMSFRATADMSTLVGFAALGDGSLIMSLAKRKISKKPQKGAVLPIDTLTFHFAPKGEGLSAGSPILSPDPKGSSPTIPKGRGVPAALSKNVGSFAIEYAPRRYAIAYGVPASEALPSAQPLPDGETPVFAAYGRPPTLLTSNGRSLLKRTWPNPGEALIAPQVVEGVQAIPSLVDELSDGPECEAGEWSFRKIQQPKEKLFVLGVSPKRTVVLELPIGIDRQAAMGCGDGRVVLQATNPTNQSYAFVTCSVEGVCTPSDASPFRIWPGPHERSVGLATWPKGVIAAMAANTPQNWGLYLTQSDNAGKNFDVQRPVGEGKGERGRYELGALLGLEKRTLLLISADLTGSSRRGWFALASEDGGQNWGSP